MFGRSIYNQIYGSARSPTDLPWHRETPPNLLVRATEAREGALGRPGRAVDLGCGVGVYSIWLARRGWHVVAIDFSAPAVAFARDLFAREGVSVDLREGDVCKFDPGAPFDLVLDSGCLHSMSGRAREVYRERLATEWLLPGGEYVLNHFLRHFFMLPPNGRKRDAIVEEIMAARPTLRLEAHEVEPAVEYVGGRQGGLPGQLGAYWFRDERP